MSPPKPALDTLIAPAVEAALDLPRGERHLIALAGPPAAGKSTLAESIAEGIRARGRAVNVVPMDGFHLDNRLLEARGLLARKGAPETFDLAGFTRMLAAMQAGGEVIYPLFDRESDRAIAGAGLLPETADLVLVEGNYLLFDRPGWRDLAAFWALTVRLTAPEALLRERLIGRWRRHGLDAEAATTRAEANDLPNAQAVLRHALPADLEIASV
ncbi:MAG: nucleoside/nucleotide kinase family protein [Pseudomonadota bacterium]